MITITRLGRIGSIGVGLTLLAACSTIGQTGAVPTPASPASLPTATQPIETASPSPSPTPAATAQAGSPDMPTTGPPPVPTAELATPVPTPEPTSVAISCQPFGYTAAPIAFSFAPGPVTSAVAEQTAVRLFRACQSGTETITKLTSSCEAGTGMPTRPNAGQAVWQVKIEATVTAPRGQSYVSAYWVEVNQATGAPTVIAYG